VKYYKDARIGTSLTGLSLAYRASKQRLPDKSQDKETFIQELITPLEPQTNPSDSCTMPRRKVWSPKICPTRPSHS